jgi:hypothetical protein
MGIGVFIILIFALGCIGATVVGILNNQFCKFCSIGTSALAFVVVFIVLCPRSPATVQLQQAQELADTEEDWSYVVRTLFGVLFLIVMVAACVQYFRMHLLVHIRAGEKLPK